MKRAFAVALLLCIGVADLGRSEAPTVREIPSPAGPASAEPNLAAGPDGTGYLSWIEKTGDKQHALRFATRKTGGAWSEARTIASGANWFVNWADFPSLAVLPDGALAAHWLARSGAGTYDYGVHVSRSLDGGRTWTEPVSPHPPSKGEHGFVSMVPWTGGRFGVVWLDGRHVAASHGSGAKGSMALMHATIARDGGLGPETVLDDRVCDCCQTSAARSGDAVVVVYRDRTEAEVRDISFVRFAEGRWSAPKPIADDGWKIQGCPVNGPSISADGHNVAVAWFSAASDKTRVRLAFSKDAGATWGAPITIDDGKPIGRVDVLALPAGGALVSWLEAAGEGAQVRVRRVAAGGSLEPSIVVADSSAARSSGFPHVARSGREVVFAWTAPGEPSRVRTAVMELAR